MSNHASHAALPYPIKGARYTLLVPYLDADGDPTDPTTPDTELSKDDGAAADAAEEVASPKNSVGMLTLTGAETDCSCLSLAGKAASGPKTTLGTIYPRVLAEVGTGTLSAGSAGGGTLGTLLAYDVTGCFIKTTGGTGGGGTGGANNQARKIVTYNTGTGAFTVTPNWETTPSTDTTYAVLLPEGVTLGMLRALNPTTAGRTLDVSAGGEAGVDWANVGSQSTSVNLSGTTVNLVNTATTVTNQLTAAAIATGVWQDSTSGDFTAANSIGKALYINNVAPGASGGHMIAGSNAGTTTFGALTVTGAFTAGTNALPWNAAYDAEVQSEVNDGLVAFWTSPATLVDLVWDEVLTAHTTPDSAGDILANVATGTPPTAAAIADAVWDEATSGHTTSGTFGEQLKTDVDAILEDTAEIGAAGAGLTNINLPNQTMDIVGNITGNLSGSVGSVTGAVGSVTGNVGGNVTGTVGSLATQAKADVNAEVLDVLSTDTFGEPTGTPGATLTLREKIGWLFMALRNGLTITASKKTFLDDSGAAEWEKDLSDDGTTYTESEGNAP